MTRVATYARVSSRAVLYGLAVEPNRLAIAGASRSAFGIAARAGRSDSKDLTISSQVS